MWDELRSIKNKEKWENPVAWKELARIAFHRGKLNKRIMATEEKVISLLGEPHRKENEPSQRLWHYGDMEDFGTVFFDQSSRQGLSVSMWAEPYWPEVEKNINVPTEQEQRMEGHTILPKWAQEEPWQEIKMGMTEKNIHELLGKPDYVQKLMHYISLDSPMLHDDSPPVEVSLCYCYGRLPEPVEAPKEPLTESLEDSKRQRWLPFSSKVYIPNAVVYFSRNRGGYVVASWKQADTNKLEYLLNIPQENSPKRGREKWEQQNSWKRLRSDMTMTHVLQLLGHPCRRQFIEGIETDRIKTTRWYYGDILGAGTVAFRRSPKKKILLVNDWSEPYWPEVKKDICGIRRDSSEDRGVDKKESTVRTTNLAEKKIRVRQITDNEFEDKLPYVSGKSVVWQGWPAKNSDIFLYDSSGITQISKSSRDDLYPKISGASIVWQNQGLFLQRKGGMVRLDKVEPLNYQISGERVVWETGDGVYYYDGAQTHQLAGRAHRRFIHTLKVRYPDISGKNLTWSEDGIFVCMIRDGTLEKRFIMSRVGDVVFYSRIHGDHVLVTSGNTLSFSLRELSGSRERSLDYRSEKDETQKIIPSAHLRTNEIDWMLATKYPLCEEFGPAIYGNNVVWIGGDRDDGSSDVFLYDGDKKINLTKDAHEQVYPQICGALVVWQGHDGNDFEIFLYDGTSVIQVTNNEYDDMYPRLSEEALVWQGWDGEDYEIFMAEFE